MDAGAGGREPVVEGQGPGPPVGGAGGVVIGARPGTGDDDHPHQHGEHHHQDGDRGQAAPSHEGGRPRPGEAADGLAVAAHLLPALGVDGGLGVPGAVESGRGRGEAGRSARGHRGRGRAARGWSRPGCTGRRPRWTRETSALRKACRIAARKSPPRRGGEGPAPLLLGVHLGRGGGRPARVSTPGPRPGGCARPRWRRRCPAAGPRGSLRRADRGSRGRRPGRCRARRRLAGASWGTAASRLAKAGEPYTRTSDWRSGGEAGAARAGAPWRVAAVVARSRSAPLTSPPSRSAMTGASAEDAWSAEPSAWSRATTAWIDVPASSPPRSWKRAT